MKKFFFTLLLVAATLPGWAGTKYPDVMYAIGTATSTNWDFDTSSAKLYKTSNYVYQGFVNFDTQGGLLKFMTAFEWNKGQWGALNNGQEITTNSGNRTTYADDAQGDSDDDKKFVFKLPTGLYLVTIDATTAGSETITFTKWETNSVYEIGNLGQLKFFANRLNTDGVSLNAKLTADIGSADGDKMDYAIGWHNGDEKSTNHKWYNGEFDGNYHTIYLNIDKRSDDNPNNQGLFGAITGGAYIHDVTVAGSVKGKSYVAGIVGSVRCNSGGGGTVNIFNCKNTAEITGSDGGTNTGGIVGVTMNYNGYCTTNVSYCCNTGNVYGKSDSGLISGWIGNGSIKHTFASGTLQGAQSGNDKREFSRYQSYQTCDFYANVTMTGSTETGGASYFNPSDATYTISDADKFLAIATMVNVGGLTSKNFTLNNDIDLSVENSHTPIGTTSHPYVGTFDGDFHTVNLNIDRSSENYQGLFGVVTDGVFIQNVIVKGRVKGNDYVGGIVGGTNGGSSNAKKTDIWNCGNEATVTAAGANAGGILGVNMSGSASIILLNCYNTGAITGSRESGALSGWLGGGWSSVRNCYNSGTLTIGDASGTAFGRNNGCHFINCFYTHSSGTYNNGSTYENTGNGQPSEISDEAVTSGELCWKFVGNDGNPFTQDLSQAGHPTFGSEEVHAGKWFNDDDWDTFYNEEGDDKIVYQLNLDETKTKYAVPANVTAKNVSVARTIPAGQWIGLCLPFDYDIPSGWDVREMTGVSGSGESASMKFSSALSIVAGKPYIVKPSAIVETITAEDKEIATGSTNVTSGGVTMVGNLYQTSLTTGDFYINTLSQLKKLNAASATLKGFRAYFTVDGGSGVKALSFDFDDDATGISLMEEGRSQMEDGAIYNLAGQRLNKMQKGINIVNGKKILK